MFYFSKTRFSIPKHFAKTRIPRKNIQKNYFGATMLLAKLSDLKRRIVESAEQFERESAPEFYSTFHTFSNNLLADCVERRVLFFVLERILRHRWEANSFRAMGFAADEPLAGVRVKLLESSATIGFCEDPLWFGGTIVRTSNRRSWNEVDGGVTGRKVRRTDRFDSMRGNALPFFSICLLLMGMSDESESRVGYMELCAARMDEIYGGNSDDFVEKLMENDERCLFTLLAILQLSASKLTMWLNPMVLFFILMRKIDFDVEVVMDWLQSECVAVCVLLRFLKFFCNFSAEKIEELFSAVDALRSSTQSEWEVVREKNSKGSNFKFNVREIHGDIHVDRTVQISRPENKLVLSDGFVKADQEESFRDEFSAFVARLGLKLERVEAKRLLPFSVKSLLAVVVKVDNLLEQFH